MDLSKNYPVMYQLAPLLKDVQDNDIVLACDIKRNDGSIGKFFTKVNTVDMFDTLVRQHGNHWYEILIPDRPTRIFLDIETTNGDYAKVKRGVETFVEMLKMWCNSKSMPNPTFNILDSSNAKKISFHVVGGPYLRNLYHVGALVRRLTCFVYSSRYEENVNGLDLSTLFDNDGNYIVDEQIYTMNRQFRLAGQCKMGSDRVLNGMTAKESFLQNPNASFTCCYEIDNAEPVSTSKKAVDIFTQIDGEWTRISTVQGKARGMHYPSALPPVLKPMESWLLTWMGEGDVTGISFGIRSGLWSLSTSCKHCKIANRRHKSNHTWITIDPWKRIVRQRCFDEDCSRKFANVAVPEELWEPWKAQMGKAVQVPELSI
jgi:hypothetical protein